MKQRLSLASRYRPQTFASVVGQPAATAALSRAAATNRIAPAYLLSGTRGVGKTTVARIFARALNCERGPAAEPCNSCVQCKKSLSGSHIDVCEIDGASNTGVDDVRALRDNLGFMPMQGRYRVFIIDEAHMLSKSAFNALLKTLEEPPGHTVFIFATTEVHRFPATIVSRCQHFVFRHLPEDQIYTHLEDVLKKEQTAYEPAALRLIAKRAAGSVRDSMSLLDQTLALSDGKLDQKTVRESLGLAGQEFFSDLFSALPKADTEKIVDLCGQLLHSGADIGYFLRELGNWWRNLFLYRQTGEKILPHLDISPDEIELLKNLASNFPLAQLHASWQMTLENQRPIALNPEPGAALELLLLNLALLPKLLPPASFIEKAAAASQNLPQQEGNEKKNLIEDHKQDQFECREDKKPYGSSWGDFCKFCQDKPDGIDVPARDILAGLQVDWKPDQICIKPANPLLAERLTRQKKIFENAIAHFCGAKSPEIIYEDVAQPINESDLMQTYKKAPEVELCEEILGATLFECKLVNSGKN